MKYTVKVHKMSWWAMLLVVPILAPALILTFLAFALGVLATVAGVIAMPWTFLIAWLDKSKGLVVTNKKSKGDGDE